MNLHTFPFGTHLHSSKSLIIACRKYWEVNYSPDGRDTTIIVAYPEWARDPYYYEHLSDDRDKEVQIFTKYQKLMDEEYD